MKNLLQFLLLAGLTGTLCAADSTATGTGAATVASQPSRRPPTYDSELADLHDDLKRSVSPDSQPYVGTAHQLKLDAKFKHNIAAAEAVAALSSTLPIAANAKVGENVEVSGTDLAKEALENLHLAILVRSMFIPDKYYLTPNAHRALLSYLAPEELAIAPVGTDRTARLAAGIARWKPKSVVASQAYVRSSSPRPHRGGPPIR